MSLNGLNEEKVNQAYESAIADAAGWFLLKYASRDAVELLSSGTGGHTEAKDAIGAYEESSPLFGMVVYRRKKVLLKYVPEGTSRLLQARLTVHLQSVIERFPHDALISLVHASDLTETALSSSVSTLKSSGSFRSTAAKAQRPLTEILEDASENQSQKRGLPPSSAEEGPDNSNAEAPEGKVPPEEEETARHTPEGEIRPARERANTAERPPPPDLRKSSIDEHRVFERPSTSSLDERPSFQSSRSLSKEKIVPYTYKPKVKLGPRPSVDHGHQSRKSGSFARPVSTLPAGIRMPARKKVAEIERPQTQQVSSRPFFPDGARMPMGSSSASVMNVPLDRPPSRSGSVMTVPAYAQYNNDVKSPTSPSITPEKQRLMKALEQRKKHQLARKAAEEALAEQAAKESELPEQVLVKKTADETIPEVTTEFSQTNSDYNLPSSSETQVESVPETATASDYGFPVVEELSNGHTETQLTSTAPAASVGEGPASGEANGFVSAKQDKISSSLQRHEEVIKKEEVIQPSAMEPIVNDPSTMPANLGTVVPPHGASEIDDQPAVEQKLDAAIEKAQADGSAIASPSQTTFLFIQPEDVSTIKRTENHDSDEVLTGKIPDSLPVEDDYPVLGQGVNVAYRPEDATNLSGEDNVNQKATAHLEKALKATSGLPQDNPTFLLDENEAEETHDQSLNPAKQPGRLVDIAAINGRDILSPEQAAFASSMEEGSSPSGELSHAAAAASEAKEDMSRSENQMETRLFDQDDRASESLLPSTQTIAQGLPNKEGSMDIKGQHTVVLGEDDQSQPAQAIGVEPHTPLTEKPAATAESPEETTPKASGTSHSVVFDEPRPSSAQSNETAYAITPKRDPVPKPSYIYQDRSEVNSLSGDSFLDEIQSATVEEAKPMVVSRSPATPIFPSSKPSSSRKSSDVRRPTSSASTSAKFNQPSMPESSYLSRSGPNNTAQLLRSGMLPLRSVSNTVHSTTLPIEVSSSVSHRLSTINTARANSTSPTLQRPSTSENSPAKKTGVSSLISQRIKALERFSNNEKQPNATTANIPPTFVSKRKASLTTPPGSSGVETVITSSARQDGRTYPTPSPSPHGNFITRTFGSRRPSTQDSKAPSERDVEPVRERAATVAVPSPKRSKPVPAPIVTAVSSSNSTSTSPHPTRPKHQKQSSSYFSRSSKRSKSKTNSVSSISSSVMDSLRDSVPSPSRNSFSSKRSMSSRNGSVDAGQPSSASSPVRPELVGSRSHSEGDKKESKKSRLLRRMSSSLTLSPRRNIAHVLSPPLNDQPIQESQEPEPHKKWTPVAIGDLNVQFPDTLFWKRRHLEVDSHGYIVLAPSKLESSSRVGTKQYHITEFRAPYIPDQDREELPHSVVLDFHDSSTLQYACENARSQQEVLKVLQSAQAFFSAAERR